MAPPNTDHEPVSLAEYAEEHVPACVAWKSSAEYRRYHPDEAPVTADDILAELRAGKYAPTAAGGKYVILKGQRVVGSISYFRPSPHFDAVELSIALTDRAVRGQGLGPRAVSLLLDTLYASFETWRVQVHILADNVRALAMFRRLGFVDEGVMRAAFRLGNARVDVCLLSMLRPDWLSRPRCW